jgi:hypothetical protein
MAGHVFVPDTRTREERLAGYKWDGDSAEFKFRSVDGSTTVMHVPPQLVEAITAFVRSGGRTALLAKEV